MGETSTNRLGPDEAKTRIAAIDAELKKHTVRLAKQRKEVQEAAGFLCSLTEVFEAVHGRAPEPSELRLHEWEKWHPTLEEAQALAAEGRISLLVAKSRTTVSAWPEKCGRLEFRYPAPPQAPKKRGKKSSTLTAMEALLNG